MERYTGNYNYLPLIEGSRALYKPDGTFPPPDVSDDDVFLTGSIETYRMWTSGDIRILELLPGSSTILTLPIACCGHRQESRIRCTHTCGEIHRLRDE